MRWGWRQHGTPSRCAGSGLLTSRTRQVSAGARQEPSRAGPRRGGAVWDAWRAAGLGISHAPRVLRGGRTGSRGIGCEIRSLSLPAPQAGSPGSREGGRRGKRTPPAALRKGRWEMVGVGDGVHGAGSAGKSGPGRTQAQAPLVCWGTDACLGLQGGNGHPRAADAAAESRRKSSGIEVCRGRRALSQKGSAGRMVPTAGRPGSPSGRIWRGRMQKRVRAAPVARCSLLASNLETLADPGA